MSLIAAPLSGSADEDSTGTVDACSFDELSGSDTGALEETSELEGGSLEA